MSIYISTNLYRPEQLKEIFPLLAKIGDPAVGIELFPEWQSEVFCRELAEHMEDFAAWPLLLHRAY